MKMRNGILDFWPFIIVAGALFYFIDNGTIVIERNDDNGTTISTHLTQEEIDADFSDFEDTDSVVVLPKDEIAVLNEKITLLITKYVDMKQQKLQAEAALKTFKNENTCSEKISASSVTAPTFKSGTGY